MGILGVLPSIPGLMVAGLHALLIIGVLLLVVGLVRNVAPMGVRVGATADELTDGCGCGRGCGARTR
jgi:hypothetical protein